MADFFEGRWEIEKLMEVLQEWLEEQTNDPKADYVEDLQKKLDFLHMIEVLREWLEKQTNKKSVVSGGVK